MLKVANSVINASQIKTPITFVGDVTLSTGNLVIGTAGKGIDFTATSGAGTSELFDDYEVGVFTPNQGGGLTVVGSFSSAGYYTKVGNLVTVTATFAGSTSVAINAGANFCTNLPFTTNSTGPQWPGVMSNNALTAGGTCAAESATTNLWATSTMAATAKIHCTVTYTV